MPRKKDKECKHNWIIAYYCPKCMQIQIKPVVRRIDAIGKEGGSISTDYIKVQRDEHRKED